MNTLPGFSLALALSLGVAAETAPRPAARPDPLLRFDAQVAQAVKDWGAPGFAIAVVKDGAVIFSKGYGVRASGPGLFRPRPQRESQ